MENNKRCPMCSKTKPISEFTKNKRNKDRLSCYCGPCSSISSLKSRKRTKEAYQHKLKVDRDRMRRNMLDPVFREKERLRKAKLRNDRRQLMVDYLKSHPCVNCHTDDITVLEFDHIDPGTKEFNIGRGVKSCYSIDRINKEIAKCAIRCGNCHWKRTIVQRGFTSTITSGSCVDCNNTDASILINSSGQLRCINCDKKEKAKTNNWFRYTNK